MKVFIVTSVADDLTPFLLIFYSFDGSPGGAGGGSSVSGTSGGKSTKGASKMRRDLINSEIANLRDLLPLPSSTRQRLSQLQLMALVLVYVRKSNYFDQGKCKLNVKKGTYGPFNPVR